MNNWNENINHHSIMIIIKTTKITRIDRILKSVFSKPHLVQGSILEPNGDGDTWQNGLFISQNYPKTNIFIKFSEERRNQESKYPN